ncbi:MAG: enterobactin receptor protein [Bacteroidota bacterium]|nr:enterobactin receptor protein [Bacteroidota bacterium]
MGQVKDPQTKKPVADAAITIEGTSFNKVVYTNDSGLYDAGNVPAGVYTVGVSYQGHTALVSEVKLSNDDVREVNLEVAAAIELKDIEISITKTIYDIPLIDKWNTTRVTVTGTTLKQEGITKVEDALETFGGGTTKIGNDYYVRGARAGSLSYYVDECKIMGSPDIPLCGLATFTSYNGFIPAKYGDTNAGVVVIETRSYFTER